MKAAENCVGVVQLFKKTGNNDTWTCHSLGLFLFTCGRSIILCKTVASEKKKKEESREHACGAQCRLPLAQGLR